VQEQQKKVVKVFVHGGVVQHVDVPEGVVAKVLDYDVEGGEAPDKDQEGRPCSIGTWEHNNG
jgi:hypothetical protein